MERTEGKQAGITLMADETRYQFAVAPCHDDFEQLAAYLECAPVSKIHPALYSQRFEIAGRLRQVAGAPRVAAHHSAYHALRLFVL